MAVRGRKPKPTALKVLEGNPGHRPLNKKEPMPKGKLPRCPEWLEDDAKKEWKGAEEFIAQHGDMVRTPNGYLQQVPQVSIAQTNLKIMMKFCEQFGLTPSARSRMIGEDTGGEREVDEMELILRG